MNTASCTLCIVIFVLVVSGCFGGEKLDQRSFPRNFKWGAATSSYQIEGAWNISGKGESVWDRWTHKHPERIKNGSNGDIACDSYHKYKEDVQLLVNLKLKFYRFSLSWPRIVPTGRVKDGVNKAGITYYKNLINELKKNGIEPYITLYHWDLPQYLQDKYGGWPNVKVADFFAEYARIAFSEFPEVKTWITINEPRQICQFGYGDGTFAPAIKQGGVLDYQCTKTLLLAHAKAYRLYKKMFGSKYGKVGFTMDSYWYEAASNKSEDIAAAKRLFEFYTGIFAQPIFGAGDWPTVVKELVGTRSALQGLPKSRLPSFTPSEIKFIKGTFDFFGLNSYTAVKVADAEWKPLNESNWDNDARVKYWGDPAWQSSSVYWLKVVPYSTRKILNALKQRYGNIEFIVTESGYSDYGELHDVKRSNYYLTYLNATLSAILEDKVNLSAYAAWSLMDNFEWIHGYAYRFGIYSVNFTDPNRPRSEKLSAKVYRDIATNNKLPLFTIDG